MCGGIAPVAGNTQTSARRVPPTPATGGAAVNPWTESLPGCPPGNRDKYAFSAGVGNANRIGDQKATGTHPFRGLIVGIFPVIRGR
jgi:hypothetical protein